VGRMIAKSRIALGSVDDFGIAQQLTSAVTPRSIRSEEISSVALFRLIRKHDCALHPLRPKRNSLNTGQRRYRQVPLGAVRESVHVVELALSWTGSMVDRRHGGSAPWWIGATVDRRHGGSGASPGFCAFYGSGAQACAELGGVSWPVRWTDRCSSR
jgi:hypothetical protein